MGHAQWILTVEDKESQGSNEENRLALHQNQHIHSCKSYQRISVLVMEVICEPQNIVKVLRSDSHIMQIRFMDHMDTIQS